MNTLGYTGGNELCCRKYRGMCCISSQEFSSVHLAEASVCGMVITLCRRKESKAGTCSLSTSDVKTGSLPARLLIPNIIQPFLCSFVELNPTKIALSLSESPKRESSSTYKR